MIPLSSPDINDEDIKNVIKVLQSGMLVQAENVLELESQIAKYLHVNNVMALSNGTATLHTALVALGIGVGDEVIVPAFSYIATANVVEIVGAKPVFVDIDIDTFNIDISKIEEVITSRTKAIIPVHEFGLCCDIEGIMKIAEKYSIHIIEDSACALGAKQRDKFAGTFGTFGSFSLHPRKAITSGEGGLLVTNIKELAEKIQVLRNHGIKISDGKMEFIEAGFNYRLTDFQAALVNNQLKRLDKIIAYKQRLAEVYFNELKHTGIKLPSIPDDRNHTWQTFHLLLDEKMERDKVIMTLREKGIGTNYGAQCIPAQKFYLDKYNLNSKELYPNSLKAFLNGLAIPIYEKLTHENILYIAQIINQLK